MFQSDPCFPNVPCMHMCSLSRATPPNSRYIGTPCWLADSSYHSQPRLMAVGRKRHCLPRCPMTSRVCSCPVSSCSSHHVLVGRSGSFMCASLATRRISSLVADSTIALCYPMKVFPTSARLHLLLFLPSLLIPPVAAFISMYSCGSMPFFFNLAICESVKLLIS